MFAYFEDPKNPMPSQAQPKLRLTQPGKDSIEKTQELELAIDFLWMSR